MYPLRYASQRAIVLLFNEHNNNVILLVPNSACYFISHHYAGVKFAELNHRLRFWPYTDCNTFIRMKICFDKTEGSSVNTIWRLLFYQHIVYRSSRCIMLVCIISYCLLEQQFLSFMATSCNDVRLRTSHHANTNELWNTVNVFLRWIRMMFSWIRYRCAIPRIVCTFAEPWIM